MTHVTCTRSKTKPVGSKEVFMSILYTCRVIWLHIYREGYSISHWYSGIQLLCCAILYSFAE